MGNRARAAGAAAGETAGSSRVDAAAAAASAGGAPPPAWVARGGEGGGTSWRPDRPAAGRGGEPVPGLGGVGFGRRRAFARLGGQGWRRRRSGVAAGGPRGGPGGKQTSCGAPSPTWVARPARGGSGGGGRGGSAGVGRAEHLVAGTVLASVTPVKVTVDSVTSDLVPIQRPDRGGLIGANNPICIRVNHFLLNFDDRMNIYHYDISVKSEKISKGSADAEISEKDLLAIKTELFKVNASRFQVRNVASDGLWNLFSPGRLPEGDFKVVVHGHTYHVTLKLQKKIPLKDLRQPQCPRDILQGLDVIMRENASRGRILVGRSFFSGEGHDLGRGIVALSGFQQSVKSMEHGPVLNVDQSVMAFRKSMMLLDYLRESCCLTFNENMRLEGRERKIVKDELNNLKVMVIHREARKMYTIFGLTELETNKITFQDDQSQRNFRLVDYYRQKYGIKINFKQLPCLKLSRTKENYVPMELCRLAEGQIYPKDRLHRDGSQMLREMAMAGPRDRENMIFHMINSANGPARMEEIMDIALPQGFPSSYTL